MFTMMIKGKECSKDEENLSAKEKTEKKRTWIQKENEVSNHCYGGFFCKGGGC